MFWPNTNGKYKFNNWCACKSSNSLNNTTWQSKIYRHKEYEIYDTCRSLWWHLRAFFSPLPFQLHQGLLQWTSTEQFQGLGFLVSLLLPDFPPAFCQRRECSHDWSGALTSKTAVHSLVPIFSGECWEESYTTHRSQPFEFLGMAFRSDFIFKFYLISF